MTHKEFKKEILKHESPENFDFWVRLFIFEGFSDDGKDAVAFFTHSDWNVHNVFAANSEWFMNDFLPLCKDLRNLNLSWCNLTKLPTWISLLPKLEYVDLKGNSFSHEEQERISKLLFSSGVKAIYF